MPKLTQFSLPTPSGTKVSSEYGPRHIGSGFHYGLDFAVPENTLVKAVGSGEVLRVIHGNYYFGNVVIIKHDDEQATLYAHLNQTSVVKNDPVDSSTILGLSGNTGEASKGPHLHFEVIEGRENIAAIANPANSATKIGIGGTVGRISNPRQFFAHYNDVEFPTTVRAGASSFGQLVGDARDNRIIGNKNPNDLRGLGGFDTYEVGFGDRIDDADSDGKIKIAGKISGSFFEGNAAPKTTADGKAIPGRWTLQGYELARSGSDLEIFRAGADVTSNNSQRITVSNFPFDAERPKFGITLGKSQTDEMEENIVTASIRDALLLPLKDSRGRFVGITHEIVRLSKDSGDYGNYDALFFLTHFDSFGNAVKKIDVVGGGGVFWPSATVFSDYYTNRYGWIEGAGEPKSIILSFRKRMHEPYKIFAKHGIAILDYATGEITGSRVVGEDEELAAFFDITEKNRLFTRHVFLIRDETGYPGSQTGYYQEMDPNTLDPIGEKIPDFPYQDRFNNLRSLDYSWWHSKITLGNGAIVDASDPTRTRHHVNWTTYSDTRDISIFRPKLRDLTPDEIKPNFDAPAGAYNPFAGLNPLEKEVLVTLQENTQTSLVIPPIANSAVAISGLAASAGSKVGFFESLDLTPEQLAARTHAVRSSQYSIEDLLSGKFVAPAVGGGQRRLDEVNSTDYEEGEEEELPVALDDVITNFDADQEFAVIALPNNQTLIFPDLTASELVQNSSRFFDFNATLPNVTIPDTNNTWPGGNGTGPWNNATTPNITWPESNNTIPTNPPAIASGAGLGNDAIAGIGAAAGALLLAGAAFAYTKLKGGNKSKNAVVIPTGQVGENLASSGTEEGKVDSARPASVITETTASRVASEKYKSGTQVL